jgi:hypothetical protein
LKQIYLTDRIAFLQLQKTGCSHVARVLEMISPGGQNEMHKRLPENVLNSGRFLAGSIRNPWDWYVSLWGYGCDGKGSLRERLTGPKGIKGHGYRNSLISGLSFLMADMRRNREFWLELYSDSSSPTLFRKWLSAVHDYRNRSIIGEDYGRSSLCQFAGLYSYRYCYLFHDTLSHLFEGRIRNHQQLLEADSEHNIVEHFVRMESINEDILELLSKSGTELESDLIKRIRSMERTNPSSRKMDFSYYYDEESAQLVKSLDAFLLKKHDYSLMSLTSTQPGITDMVDLPDMNSS